ncbi:major tail protein [Microbacterium phage Zeta1847]|uniref:Major tail protein n=1 Tax=Microbacterium phage Zeta1847 TaxID=2201444 RepID=A0A2Z4Q9R1_9CAUD|nr:major tail protein [Microbacterium phage Zeta1847]AWY06645.1 major tail protein [Microbacterium phage Zeta1847]
MSGNAENTSLWADADVYVAPENTEGPADLAAAWAAAWNAVGLLDGEEGFTESREAETAEHYAWGGKLFKRSTSKHKRTIKFVALEDNDTMFSLINPGSTRSAVGGVRSSVIKTPKSGVKFAIGFETREGDKIKRRFAKHAEVVEVADIKESETDPTVYEVTVVIFPEADGTLYRTIETDPDAGA